MKRNLILLLFLLIMFAPSISGSNSENYVGRPLGEALADFCKKNPGLKISFIYDELEDYKVKESPKSDDAMQALRSLVAMNPVSITVEGDEIYIEARQKGKYKYGGRTVDDLTGEPVSYATVLLQNPKDTTTITYGITDENGYFSIPCDRKNVQVRFSSVGYHTLYLKSAPKDMGKVRLRRQTMKLGEMTKTADSRYAMTDRTVYLPTQREKKAAQDGLSLLRFMGIPSLIVSMDGSSISTLSGDGVAVFIDYERAGATEIQGLLPEDVKKVEVLDYPSDPRFEGVSHAVNFIMAKYEYGGYVKPAINQCLDFDYGYYSLSAKYTKGKMAYDIYTGFDHFDSDKECKESDETYDFGSYDLKKTDKCIDSFVESDEAYLSGRIKYTGDKTTVSNQLAIRYDYSPTVRNVGMNT
ncbi:MAG: carboxypeptidase-like regulatory domain-containing protein, partial [Muribaculaceae bacterium]|nr:carboxypeptidase-like regulatory domain-containing protein [Muribaculaceae bacterium]